MNERPVGVADAEVVSALREHWGLAVTRLEYLPVGYGGYHWAATGPGGQRMFVTLSEPSPLSTICSATWPLPARLC